MLKWELVICFVVLGAHVKVLTPINGCHSNFDILSRMYVLVKVNYMLILILRQPLCSHQRLFWEFFAYVELLETWDNLYIKCNVG